MNNVPTTIIVAHISPTTDQISARHVLDESTSFIAYVNGFKDRTEGPLPESMVTSVNFQNAQDFFLIQEMKNSSLATMKWLEIFAILKTRTQALLLLDGKANIFHIKEQRPYSTEASPSLVFAYYRENSENRFLWYLYVMSPNDNVTHSALEQGGRVFFHYHYTKQ